MTFLDDEYNGFDDIPEILRSFRNRHKLTQYALAALLNVTQGQISAWECKKSVPNELRFQDLKEKLERYENALE